MNKKLLQTLTPIPRIAILSTPQAFLYDAASTGNAKRVKELLASLGPDVFNSKRNSDGNTALHVAFINKHYEVVDLILDAIQATSSFSNISDSRGLTYLHIACTRKDEQVIQGLLDAGTSINVIVDKKSPDWAGFNALHFSASFQSLQAIKVLLKAGIPNSSQTCLGKTALDLIQKSF